MNAMTPGPTADVTGRKSKKGGTDASNTLRSKARARLIFALSEGPIVGLVDGAKSIYREQTPLQNADDTFNVENVTFEEHKGYADDTHFAGHDDVGAFNAVGMLVEASTGPHQETIVAPEASAVRVIVKLNALFKVDDKGAMQANSVTYAIDIRTAGGSWTEAVLNALTDQKCVSPVQFQHRIDLPVGGGPWDVRLRRVTADETDDKRKSEIYFDSYTVLTEGKYTYPHTAAVALEINAEDVGSSVGSIGFKVRGRLVEVPTNYDPVTRAYTGVWDGTFKEAYTTCPPWLFRDLVINDRFGMGEFVGESTLNKWALYTIAQWCDQLVPTGYKDDLGNDILEPRYTYNGEIKTRREAFHVLREFTTAWRGMGYWSLGQMFATADMPEDPVALITPANTRTGRFVYSSTSTKSRHSVVLVRWKDPNNFYREAIEPVISNEMVKRYGWREKTVTLQGCTSRGLAHRYGRWILDVEQHETETVTYEAGLDQINVVPGNIVKIADPRKAGGPRMGGRVVSAAGNVVTLDAPLTMQAGETYTIQWKKPDGALHQATVASASGNTVTVTPSLGGATRPKPNAVYMVTASSLAPRQFRVLGVAETGPSQFEVTALFHDPQKYDRVERGLVFDPIPYVAPPAAVPAPKNLVVVESNSVVNGQTRSRLTVSWTPPTNVVVRGYTVEVATPTTGVLGLPMVSTSMVEMDVIDPGAYTFKVRTVDYVGGNSSPAEITYTVKSVSSFAGPQVSGLALDTGGTVFYGQSPRIVWQNLLPTSSTTAPGASAETSPLFSHSVVEVRRGDDNALLRTETIKTPEYVYDFAANKADNQALGKGPSRSLKFTVTTHDVNGQVSAPASLTISNPVPAAPVPTFSVSGNAIVASWGISDEQDVTGAKVFFETSSGFNPATATPKFDGPGGTYTFVGVTNTTYYARVGLYDSFGKTGLVYSSEVQVATASGFTTDTTPPAVPTGLALSSTLEGDKARLVASWTAVADADLAYYDVQIKEGAGNYVGFVSTQASYNWLLLPATAVTVRVRAVDQLGNASVWSTEVAGTAASDTVPPAVPAPVTLTPGFAEFWLEWPKATEADFSFFEVIEKTNATAPGAGAAATWTTQSNVFLRNGLGEGVTRYYWVRAVDTSGNRSAWSAGVSGTTGTLAGSQPAPAVPANLALTTALLADGDARITATWSAAANATSYELGVTRSGAAESVIATGATGYEFIVPTGLTYRLRVRGVNNVGVKSAWSAIVNVTAAADTTAPAVPTGLVATGGFESIWLKWAANTEADFAFYEVAESTTTSNPGTATYTAASTTLVRQGLGDSQTRHYWIRAVDTSGNRSAWSARVPATTAAGPGVTTEDLAGIIDATSFAQGIEPVTIVDALPTSKVTETVYLTTDSTLYRWDAAAGAYTAATDASLIVGQLTAGQIAAGAIGAEQIAAGAIGAEKLAVGDLTNLVPNGDLANGTGGWTINAGSFAIIPRDTASGTPAVATAPTPNIFRSPNNGLTNKFNYTVNFSVTPDEPIRLSYRYAGSAVHATAPTTLHLHFKDAAGAYAGQIKVDAVGLTTAWQLTEAIVNVPAGADTCYLVQLVTGGAVYTYMADLWAQRANAGSLIVDGTITGNMLSATDVITETAQIANAVITNAKIVSVEAGKITAESALLGSITVDGTALSTTTSNAADPATVINNASTQIDPGKVTIQGATTLDSWIAPNKTTINGGQIETGTILAAAIKIGDFTNHAIGGDFEDAANLPFALSGPWGRNTSNATYIYSGLASLSISGAMTGNSTFYRDMDVVEGEQVLIECAARRTSAFDATDGNCRIRVTDAVSGTYIGALKLGAATLTTSWAWHQQVIVVPPGVTRLRFLAQKADGTTGYAYVDDLTIRKMLGGDLIVEGAITANHVGTNEIIANTANIANGVITNAKIASIEAGKITADSALLSTITVNGQALGTIQSQADDPAAVVNDRTTLIDPGRIRISGDGSTTIADWRTGPDLSEINGGKISANTIVANALTIGLRNITLSGIVFEHNSPAANQVSWTAGEIRYINDAGASTSKSITAGNATWTSGTLYLYWAKDATTLSATTTQSVAIHEDNVILATYKGTTKLTTGYGQTIIDGSNVKTGTITALQIAADAITVDQLKANSVTTDKLVINGVTTEKIADDAITEAVTKRNDNVKAIPNSSFTKVVTVEFDVKKNKFIDVAALFLVESLLPGTGAFVRWELRGDYGSGEYVITSGSVPVPSTELEWLVEGTDLYSIDQANVDYSLYLGGPDTGISAILNKLSVMIQVEQTKK